MAVMHVICAESLKADLCSDIVHKCRSGLRRRLYALQAGNHGAMI